MALNLSGYPAYLELMVQYRKNMGELYTEKVAVDKDTYWKNRELIKQLRYHALTENIDLYALEFDAKSVIKAEVLDRQIKPLIERSNELRDQIASEQAKIYADIAAGRKPDQTKFNNLQKEQVNNNIKLQELQADKDACYTEDEQKGYEKYIKEAYLVKQMVDVRERYERATTPQEKQKLADEAYQIRLQVNKIILGHDSVDDFERRVWLMYTGEDISGLNPNRTPEQKEQWESHIALMRKATADYKAMKTDEQLALEPTKTDAQLFEDNYGQAGRDMWRERQYETFSGADMAVYFAFPGYRPIDIGTASLISYSIYREKKQLRTIGAINAKGITKGPRTISGRMVFTVIREHIVEMIKRELPYTRALKNLLMDELPPFDILVSFGNEYGASAGLVIQGVTFVDEQKTMTVDDLYTENIYTYLARDVEVMKNMAASVQDPYDPLEWYSSNFIPMGSEILGNFKPSELQVFKSGELLSDPAPFYGSAAGWNAELYNLMYNGEVVEVGQSPNTPPPSSGGGGGTPGKEEPAPPKDPGDDDLNDNGVEKWKEKTEPYLWTDQIDNVLKKKNMYAGGYQGQYFQGKTKKNRWGLKNRRYGATKPDYKELLATMKKSGSSNDDGNNSDMTVTLKMFKRYVGEEEFKNNEKNAQKNADETVGGFTVLMNWSYFTPKVYKGGVSMVNEKPTDTQMSRGTVMGYWKEEFSMNDLTKAAKSKVGGTGDAAYWVHKVDVSDKRYGYSNGVKKISVGDVGNPSKLNSKKSENWGAYININSGGTTIDLRDYLWFVSAIAPATGQRTILDFSDLPIGAQVLVHFQYCISTPSNPTTAGAEKRHFFIKLTRSKVGDGIGNNGFTNNYDTKNKIHQYRHEKWNRNDYASGK